MPSVEAGIIRAIAGHDDEFSAPPQKVVLDRLWSCQLRHYAAHDDKAAKHA